MAEVRFSTTDNNGMPLIGLMRCLDCGVLLYIEDKETHSDYHNILSDIAGTLAVLQNVHMSPAAHNRFNVQERIQSLREKTRNKGE